MNDHYDVLGKARHRLVDAIVHHLVHQMVKASGASASNVHPWALANRIDPLEYLDV